MYIYSKFIMQLFSADATYSVFKMKNRPQKLLIIGPQLFFMYWPGCPNGPETEILYHQKPLNAGLGI